MPLQLFPYQREAVDAILAAHASGTRRPAIAAATGAGKTIMFSQVINESNERSLVIAHRKELIDQAAQKVGYMIDPADVGVVMADRNQADYPIVIASIQTIQSPARLRQLGQFGLVVVDEAHHAAAPIYVETLRQLGVGAGLPTKALGVSATWDRADKLGFEHVFDEIVFEVGIEQLIASGHLSDVRALSIETHLSMSGIPGNGAGDFNTEALSRRIVDSDYADTLANAVREHASDRTCLVFAPNVRTAELFAETLNGVDVPASWVSGDTPKLEREQAIADLRAGRLQAIVNCAVFTEGTDIPIVDCIVMGRPTKSRALYQQMAGRGLRTYPTKTDCLIIDLVGATGKHQIQTAASLLGREIRNGATEVESFLAWIENPALYEEQDELEGMGGVEVKGKLGQEFTQTAKVVDLIDRKRLAWSQIDFMTFSLPAGEQGQVVISDDGTGHFRVVQYDGRQGIKRELGRGLDIGYAQGVAEAFVAESGASALANPNARWRKPGVPASDKQKAALDKWRIPYAPDITKAAASDLLEAAIARANLRRRQWNEEGEHAHAS
jgi:superfamily II DNA or RNA helicase